MSSLYGGTGSKLEENAIDGAYNEEGSVAHTNRERSTWIQIHLTSVEIIEGAQIWNRCESSEGETNMFHSDSQGQYCLDTHVQTLFWLLELSVSINHSPK